MAQESNFITNLEISNYKSIKLLREDCKRVNLFIGKPNVGKSNILEAISLLGASYSTNRDKFLKEFIRYEVISNLFYDNNASDIIEISAGELLAVIKYRNIQGTDAFDLTVGDRESIAQSKLGAPVQDRSPNFIWPKHYVLNDKGNILADSPYSESFSSVKPYIFNSSGKIADSFPIFLRPPYGNNLFSIVDQRPELRKEIVEVFSEYNLKFVADRATKTFELQKDVDGYITRYNYSSMADTFQRLFFYYAAIDSNENSIIVLEEPEVHSFPPYTKELSQRIIDSDKNQFFITTHSPYLLQNFIENLRPSDLNVFITYFSEEQTKVKRLSEGELRSAMDFGVDLFYNLDQFIPKNV